MPHETSSTSAYRVLVNDDQQVLVWPAVRVPPAGWRQTRMTGSQAECLAYVDQVWAERRSSAWRAAPQTSSPDGEAL